MGTVLGVVGCVFLATLIVALVTDWRDRRAGRPRREVKSLWSIGREQRQRGQMVRDQMQRRPGASRHRIDRR